MAEPVFRFTGRAVISDDSGYYHPRWDRAQDLSVLASTKKKASLKASAMLGKSNRSGWSWRVMWDSINEEHPPGGDPDGPQ